jgi:methionyl-tRNA formyltransferase
LFKIGIILTPDSRSKAYLQKLIANNFVLDEIIFMNDKRNSEKYSTKIIEQSKKNSFDLTISVESTLKNNNLKYHEFDFVDINNEKLITYLQKSKIDFYIFTGGGILKNDVINSGTKFIHFHSGIVPSYRGSTTFYYSILNEKKCGVTAYIMDENLDTGDIIYQKSFSKPDHEFVDEVYDAHIRSETLIDVMKKKLFQNSQFKKQVENGETYYIIHPVLKHIALLSCLKNK